MQSGFFVEAFVDRMIDDNDPVVRRLLDRAAFYVVPNMDPDGARRGHTRMNAAGANLNREWACAKPRMQSQSVARAGAHGAYRR